MIKRTHNCGELRVDEEGQEVRLNGWVNTIRDQGKGLVFIDVRDRFGLTQVVFELEACDEALVTEAQGLSDDFSVNKPVLSCCMFGERPLP